MLLSPHQPSCKFKEICNILEIIKLMAIHTYIRFREPTLYIRFSKIIPSFFTIKEGPTSHLCLLSSGEKWEIALRCSEPLRSKVGGPSKVFAKLCGMGPPDYRLIPISYMLFSEFNYLSVNNFFPKFVQSSFIPVLYNLLFFCIREFDRTLLFYF